MRMCSVHLREEARRINHPLFRMYIPDSHYLSTKLHDLNRCLSLAAVAGNCPTGFRKQCLLFASLTPVHNL
jgi:hypothetical protein